jgi:site-specific DNA recombinase
MAEVIPVHAVRPDAVAIYIRWSTDEQTEGTTLETQRERCSLYVRSQGWAVNPDLIFVDDGFSGASLDRPALGRLRELIRAGQVDCVVTYAMDRLSRSVADTVQLVQDEWAGTCIYRSASQPISTEDGNPTGQLIFNVLASFAEFERALIRERTHSGLVRRAQQGMYPGTRVPPYGYRRDGKGHLVIDSMAPDGTLSGPAAVVRQMFELAVTGPAGHGPTAIARALAAAGVPAPAGSTWWAHQVRLILQNPVYCGDLVYGRRRVNPAHRRNKAATQRLCGQQPLAKVANAVPAIVTREVWERAQRGFALRAAGRAGAQAAGAGLQARNRSLLAGIARCRCGGPLSIFYDGRKQPFYRCSRNATGGEGCPCAPGVLPAGAVESAVSAAVLQRYGTAELRAAALAEAARSRSGEEQDLAARSMDAVERRLAAIAGDLARVRRAARRGEIGLATFEELKADAEAERRELEERRAALKQALEAADQAGPRGPVGGGEADGPGDARGAAPIDLWAALDVSQQRQVLYGLLRSLVIFRARGSSGPAEIDLVWEAP